MATLRMASLWKDPRTGILTLRKRIPTRYQGVSGHRGSTIKFSAGTADRKEAERRLPDLLERWAEQQAEWERKLNVVTLTPERALQIGARWAEWIAAGGAKLDTAIWDGPPETVARAINAQVPRHADEALAVAGISMMPDTRSRLVEAMWPLVWQGQLTGVRSLTIAQYRLEYLQDQIQC